VRTDGDHQALRAALEAIRPLTPTEVADLAAVLDMLDQGEPWSRATRLHVTGSALIVHPPSRRVLLRWHRRQQAWLQVGGHADPGELDPFDIARREGVEETGLVDLRPWPGPLPSVLHLVVVPVPAGGSEPAHEHADMRYVLATDRPDEGRPESPDAPVRWLSLDEAARLTSEANLRESLARLGRLLDR
jgi:8-oxo-dGTP pyrophosphatase MutT (NUDIX family)